jgi:hypothetical protein
MGDRMSTKDNSFIMEACKLWRVLYGNQIAFSEVSEYFASTLPSSQRVRGLRSVAKNARRLADRLDGLSDKYEAEAK